MLFNFLMGVGGLLLAGDTFSRIFRSNLAPEIKVIILGVFEILTGLYFLIAAIGA